MIVTFYSYKGGVGRSMAVANVGEILADLGYEVIVCDWDLEAPGLERYFTTQDDELRDYRTRQGLVDLILEYKQQMASGPPADAMSGPPREESPEAFRTVGNLRLRRPTSLTIPIPSITKRLGSVRLLTAGRREQVALKDYLEAVRALDWKDFYYSWAGDAYLEFLRTDLENNDDKQRIVLIDSRTGVTEIGGVCTHHLADLVVVMSAPNESSLEGTRRIADMLADDRLRVLRGGRALGVLPVAARVELSAQGEELEAFRQRFLREFEGRVPSEIGDARSFLTGSEIPYKPYFGFHERITARADVLRDREMYAAYQHVSEAIVRWGMQRRELQAPSRKLETVSSLEHEIASEKFPTLRVFMTSSSAETSRTDTAILLLEEAGVEVVVPRSTRGTQTTERIAEQLAACDAYVVLICPEDLDGWASAEVDFAVRLANRNADRGLTVIALLQNDVEIHRARSELDTIPILRMPGESASERSAGMARVLKDMRSALDPLRPDAMEVHETCPFPGLDIFDVSRARFYFGRDPEVAELLELIGKINSGGERWLQIEGASGVGKSSLMGADPTLLRSSA